MRIVVAPDSFKGSMSSRQAAQMIAQGIIEVCPEVSVMQVPIADGGEGTVESILEATSAERVELFVEDPLGRPVKAHYAWFPSTKRAVIEMAEASGLNLLTMDEYDPWRASTYGTGQLIKDALDRGALSVVIGLGGSATVDAGIGLLQALGLICYDADGQVIHRVGGRLAQVDRLDLSQLDPRLRRIHLTIAADVTNPLLGSEGAVYLYGPQKGIPEEALSRFEKGMQHYADVVQMITGKRREHERGTGAAGGVAFSLLSFFQAELKSGIELVLELCRLESYLFEADLVITGEGKVDRQSLYGKGPIGVARMAKRYKVPCIALVGSIEGKLTSLKEEGVELILPIMERPISLELAMQEGPQLLYRASKRLMKTIQLLK